MIAAVTASYYWLGLNPVLAFWAAYILTRPLGASLGDLLSQPFRQWRPRPRHGRDQCRVLCRHRGLVVVLTRDRAARDAHSPSSAGWATVTPRPRLPNQPRPNSIPADGAVPPQTEPGDNTMKTIHAVPLALAALLALGAVDGIAHAAERNQDQADIAALASHEGHAAAGDRDGRAAGRGKAVSADVVQESGATRIAVEVGGQGGVKTVLVDAQSGKVTATHDGGQDREDTTNRRLGVAPARVPPPASSACNPERGKAMKVLVIEDDAETASYIARGLHEHGHLADHAPDGREGLLMAGGGCYDVMVVDRMLPGIDGIGLVRTLRGAGVKAPVLFLTALRGVGDRVQGLEAGGTTTWSSRSRLPSCWPGSMPWPGARPCWTSPPRWPSPTCSSTCCAGPPPAGASGSSCSRGSSACWSSCCATPAG